MKFQSYSSLLPRLVICGHIAAGYKRGLKHREIVSLIIGTVQVKHTQLRQLIQRPTIDNVYVIDSQA